MNRLSGEISGNANGVGTEGGIANEVGLAVCSLGEMLPNLVSLVNYGEGIGDRV